MDKAVQEKCLLKSYYDKFDKLARGFLADKNNMIDMQNCIDLLKDTKVNESRIYIIGNGGSSAVAEHAAIDFTKNAGLQAIAFSGTPMLTTFSNDYGYENVFKKAIEIFGKENDILIAISSSGMSKNIITACAQARKANMHIITLSGFNPDNDLRRVGDINFWVDSKAFGYLEILHGLILHWINDSIVGSEEYMIR